MDLGYIQVVVMFVIHRHCQVVESAVVRQPSNAAVVQGSNVSFGCSSDEPKRIRWDYYRLGTTQPATIWNGRDMDERLKADGFYLVDVVSCQQGYRCDIGIASVNVSSAGSIVCFEVGKMKRYAASLIVLENITQCHLNVSSRSSPDGTSAVDVSEYDNLEVSCAVNYSGNWTPVIQCSTSTSALKRSSTINEVLYDDVITITSSLHGKSIQCVTSFDHKHRRPSGLAEFTDVPDVPALQLSWKSPKFIILPPGVVSSPSSDVESTVSSSSASTRNPDTAASTGNNNNNNNPLPDYVFFMMMALTALLALCVVVIIVLVTTVLKRRGDRRAIAMTRASMSTSLISANTSRATINSTNRYPDETVMTSSRSVDDVRPFSNVRGFVPIAPRSRAIVDDAAEQNIYCEVETTPSPNDQRTQSGGTYYSGLDTKTSEILKLKPPPVYARMNTGRLANSTSSNAKGDDNVTCTAGQQQQAGGEYRTIHSRNSENDEYRYPVETDVYNDTNQFYQDPATATTRREDSPKCYQGLDDNLDVVIKCNNTSPAVERYEQLKESRGNDNTVAAGLTGLTIKDNGCKTTTNVKLPSLDAVSTDEYSGLVR